MRLIFIPDTQVKEGVPLDHLEAAGNYIVDKKPDIIVHAGDHADMPSLNSHERKGSKYFEGKRYRADIESALEGMELLVKPLNRHNKRQRKHKKACYNPRMVLTMGNHEHRINRAVQNEPMLEGVISTNDLKYEEFGWEVYPYQEVVEICGVLFSHNFVNPDSMVGSTVSGTINNKLSKIKQSFTMGHQQKRQFGTSYTGSGREIMGLVAGRFYQHEEEYLGPQKQTDWSGIVVKNELENGTYDPCFVSMKYLLENYL